MVKKAVRYKLFNSRITAVISVSMVLFLMGIVAMVLFMSKNLSDHVSENFIFKLTLKDNLSDKELADVQKQLQLKPYIRQVVFVSKDSAINSIKQQLGEDPVEFCDVNPLPDAFDVSLKASSAHPDSLKAIEADLLKVNSISEVDYSHELLQVFTSNIRHVMMVLSLISIVLLLISFTLINNTIRLLIYSNRFIIYTMRQVGATRSFIRKPYLKQGLFIALAASVLASVFVAVLFLGMDDLRLFVDFSSIGFYVSILGTIFVTGILITELATYLAVNKYLSQPEEALYLI